MQAEKKHRALIVATSYDHFDSNGKKTGYWLSEVAHFYEALTHAGIDCDIASPSGGEPPLDRKSASVLDRFLNRKLLKDPGYQNKISNTRKISEVKAADYDIVYFAGGHGVMYDFPDDAALARLGAEIYERGGIVSSVCHGACGLLNIKLASGQHLIEGKKVAGYTNSEELLSGLRTTVPFLLEDALKKKGARFVKRPAFLPFAVADGRLITGQNPFSSKAVARMVLKALQA
ncbi:MAG: type 1 glutamine amidotransferase domain-containing protein [Leptospirales bacterium]|nr:type 1 glutamine amidotransferase domain-containing protein [Leptospirales bacterium]